LSGAEKGRLTRRYTENAEAYKLYLKGRYFWNKRVLEGLKKSIEYFQQATEIDLGYALAYAGISDAYAKIGDVGITGMAPSEAFSKARSAAGRALEIDSTLGEAHASMAHIHMHAYEWPAAEREFKLAIGLSPNLATAHHWYAYYLMMFGRVDEALKEAARALELDPLSLPINNDLGELLYFARRYDEAIEQLLRTLELDLHYYNAHFVLARVYIQKEMYDEAIAESRKALELSEESTDAMAGLGHAYAAALKKEEALAVLAQLIEVSKQRYVSPYDVAILYVYLCDPDLAFEWLLKAYQVEAEWMIYVTIDPRLEPLRGDPRFTELARLTGLSP